MAASEAHPNAQTIRRLYAGIKAYDLDEIAACYHPKAHFEDIAFEREGKPEVMQMWQMICMKTKPVVTDGPSPPQADDEKGSGSWKACYRFGAEENPPGRPVENELYSTFQFRDGQIVYHKDKCNLLRWALQAMPLPKALGAVAFRHKRQAMAREKLDKFLQTLPPAERARFA
jgi:ketosteroid isomerase-like protein